MIRSKHQSSEYTQDMGIGTFGQDLRDRKLRKSTQDLYTVGGAMYCTCSEDHTIIYHLPSALGFLLLH